MSLSRSSDSRSVGQRSALSLMMTPRAAGMRRWWREQPVKGAPLRWFDRRVGLRARLLPAVERVEQRVDALRDALDHQIAGRLHRIAHKIETCEIGAGCDVGPLRLAI